VLKDNRMELNRMITTEEINKLTQILLETAKIHQFNFKHPDVINVSEQLDKLILEDMRNRVQKSCLVYREK
jgi:hypothetical protein